MQQPTTVELVDLASSERRTHRLVDLSAYGCHVDSIGWPAGTKVTVRIQHCGAAFAATGSIVYVRPVGMGILFINVEPNDQLLLSKWTEPHASSRDM
jgi:hypothetical protein